MNLLEATAQAEKKINSAEDALVVAIEMLDAIKDGHSYGSFEYLAALYRMRKFVPKCPHCCNPITEHAYECIGVEAR